MTRSPEAGTDAPTVPDLKPISQERLLALVHPHWGPQWHKRSHKINHPQELQPSPSLSPKATQMPYPPQPQSWAADAACNWWS